MAVHQEIIDYATGKTLRATPEESVRQLFERMLIDDLGYPREHINIEVPIQRGSKRANESADIVVFNGPNHLQENAYIVVEIEAPGKTYDRQAVSYVTATTAPYCVWFSGFEKNCVGPYYLYRDLANDPINFIPLPTLPRFGESFDSIGKYRKHDLKPAKALRFLFKRIHHQLYGSGPIKREENVAREVIKLIFCKIADELSPEKICHFRATPSELAPNNDKGKKEIKNRIDEIYRGIQSDPDFGDMFANDPLEYDAEWIAYIVAELQGISLTHEDTNTDALGDAYEVFLPSSFKGENGQFFTPREVVRFAIETIAPSFTKKEIVLDPACGSGGFLSIVIEYLRGEIHRLYDQRRFSKDRLEILLKDHASQYIYGCDIEPLLYRIAKSYMAIIGEGKTNIFNLDSLKPLSEFPKPLQKILGKGVDVILTNPPFGTKIDEVRPAVLGQFDLGHVLSDGRASNELLRGQDPDKLFLERDIQFLRDPDGKNDGGRMCIVLPRQNLSGTQTTSVELRKWLMRQVRVLAVIDLPREAFQPHTGTKTSLVFLRKETNTSDDYQIFMATSECVGHDKRGNPVYRKDEKGNLLLDERGEPIIHNDLLDIISQWKNFVTGKLVQTTTAKCFIVSSEQIKSDDLLRLDAGYHDPDKSDLVKKLENALGDKIIDVSKLGDVAEVFYPARHKRNYVKPSANSLPFYSGTQILQIRPFDVKHQPKNAKTIQQHIVKKDWILITRSGSTGRVVIVNEYMAESMVSEHVIRVVCDEQSIDPYYVYAFLACEQIGKVLMQKGIYASVVDQLAPEFIRSLPIPRLTPAEEKRIADAMRSAEKKRAEANSIFVEMSDHLQSILADAAGIELCEHTKMEDTTE